MRKITTSVADDTGKRARVAGTALDTSGSPLVKTCPQQIAATESESERLRSQEREIRSRIENFTASPRLSREHTHGRSL